MSPNTNNDSQVTNFRNTVGREPSFRYRRVIKIKSIVISIIWVNNSVYSLRQNIVANLHYICSGLFMDKIANYLFSLSLLFVL